MGDKGENFENANFEKAREDGMGLVLHRSSVQPVTPFVMGRKAEYTVAFLTLYFIVDLFVSHIL